MGLELFFGRQRELENLWVKRWGGEKARRQLQSNSEQATAAAAAATYPATLCLSNCCFHLCDIDTASIFRWLQKRGKH
jgi:hypothetical protein